MSISPFIMKNPTSFGFDAPGQATAHPRGVVDDAAAKNEAARTSEAAPLSPELTSARSIDPMLLVYQERAETFRLVARFVGRVFGALTGRRPASRGTVRRNTSTLVAS